MPKSKTRKKEEKCRSRSKLPESRLPWWKRHWKGIAAIAGTIAAVVGFLSALVTFLPRLTVEPAGQIDPSSPYPISFTIANIGIVPLSEVQPALGVCDIIYGEPKNLPERCVKIGTFLMFDPWAVKVLAADERYTIQLDEALNIKAKFGAADIAIKIGYYPWKLTSWPFRITREFRFQTRLGDEGKLSWKARPLEK
jgi:hypothetical protein